MAELRSYKPAVAGSNPAGRTGPWPPSRRNGGNNFRRSRRGLLPMTDERELLLSSLPPAEADWAEFEARFLGKKPDCPLTADLIELAQGEAAPDAAARLREHLKGCDYCRGWAEAYRQGWDESADGA